METIGVVIATHNGERYFKEQMDSILGQTRKPDRIVVVDDGSTDGTRRLIGDYKGLFPDLFVVRENETNLGSKRTFEVGISLCDTDYIALSDQDDIWEADKIATSRRLLEGHLGALLCFHDLKLIDDRGIPVGVNFWNAAPVHEPLPVTGAAARERLTNLSNPVPGCTMFFSSKLRKQILPMPPLKWVGHDWWISVVAFFLANPVCIKEPLARYRLHPEQTAGIGLALKKASFPRKKRSLAFKLRREIERIFRGGLSRNTRLLAERERTREMCGVLLSVITTAEEVNLDPRKASELKRLKEKVGARLAVLS